MPLEERQLRRKWAALLVVFGFIVGLGLCLTVAHDDNHHHASGKPWTVSHTSQACGTSVVPCKTQLAPISLGLLLSLNTEQDAFYEGISLRPPFPPPRSYTTATFG